MQTITIIELPVAEEEQPTVRKLTYEEWLIKTIEEIKGRLAERKGDVAWWGDRVLENYEALERAKLDVEKISAHLATFEGYLAEEQNK